MIRLKKNPKLHDMYEWGCFRLRIKNKFSKKKYLKHICFACSLFAWVLFEYFSSFPQFEDVRLRITDDSKLLIGVNVTVYVVYCLCDDLCEPSTVPGVPCVLPNDN